MDNNHIITQRVYPQLRLLGLRQNREKFYLDDAGHRGFSVDIGSSRGEVLIRVEDNGIMVERIPITNENQVIDALVVVTDLVNEKKAKVGSNWQNVGMTEKGFETA